MVDSRRGSGVGRGWRRWWLGVQSEASQLRGARGERRCAQARADRGEAGATLGGRTVARPPPCHTGPGLPRGRAAEDFGSFPDDTWHAEPRIVESLEEGTEQRPGAMTTLMIRNIPHECTTERLLELWPIDGTWDFFYLPMKAGGKGSLGYAFINFVSEAHASGFASQWDARSLPRECGGGRRLKARHGV